MHMELNDFISKLAELFEDTDPQELTPDTYFRELEEWSSIMALSIIAMVSDEYDVTLKGVDIRQANTIEDLFEVVKSKA